MAFKNALCLAGVPEGKYGAPLGIGPRYSRCQRKSGHVGPHKSWSRTWKDGDEDSQVRLDNGPIAMVPEDGGI